MIGWLSICSLFAAIFYIVSFRLNNYIVVLDVLSLELVTAVPLETYQLNTHKSIKLVGKRLLHLETYAELPCTSRAGRDS